MRNLLASFLTRPLYERIPVIAMLRHQATQVRVASDRLVLRVAERYLLAEDYHPSSEQDTMARLQVLEGAAGLAEWTWSRNPRQGLAKARAYFADKPGVTLDPSWLVWADTGMVTHIFRIILSMLASSRATGEMRGPADILINGLMGIGTTGVKYPGGPTLYGVGKKLADQVFSGKETPASVASGTGALQFKQRALDTIKGLRTKQRITGPTVRDDEETGEIPDPSHNIPYWEFLADILSSPTAAGEQMRAMFLASAKGSEIPFISAWLERIQREHGDSPQIINTMAKEMGVQPGTLTGYRSRTLQRFWPKFKDSPLGEKLEDQYTLRHP